MSTSSPSIPSVLFACTSSPISLFMSYHARYMCIFGLDTFKTTAASFLRIPEQLTRVHRLKCVNDEVNVRRTLQHNVRRCLLVTAAVRLTQHTRTHFEFRNDLERPTAIRKYSIQFLFCISQCGDRIIRVCNLPVQHHGDFRIFNWIMKVRIHFLVQ